MKAKLVTATDIAQWAETIESRALLPKLIRKLAVASKMPFSEIRFPSEEGIQEPDWDGVLDSPSKTTFIPKGKSGWEVSAKKAVRVKADKDIVNRTKAYPVAKERRNITYVCVTARRWPDKKSWMKEHNVKGKKRWRKVIAYDAADIEAWLESSSLSTHVWLSELLGKKPLEVMSIDAAWKDWASVSKRPLTMKLIKAGRKAQSEGLLTQLNGPPQVVMIKGETRDEVQAFLAASVLERANLEKEQAAERVLVVKTREAWDLYALSETPLILVAMFSERGGIDQAVAAGHTVVIPMDRSDGDNSEAMHLPPIDRTEAQEALREMGHKADQVRELAFAGRRSLMSLRRQLATIPEIHAPQWSTGDIAEGLISALLFGSWVDDNEHDRELFSRLTGKPYEEVRSELIMWSTKADTPIKRVGPTWYVVSREDLWMLLAKRLTAEHLNTFTAIAAEVLSKPHPSFELPPDERPMARLRNSRSGVSDTLRHAIVDSLGFMGARGGAFKLADQSAVEGVPRRVVRDVLKAANSDWRIWASLNSHLPTLAEASPEQFLAGVAAAVKLTPSPLAPLFVEEKGFLFPQSHHGGLLWALETLAWRSEHVGQALNVLSDLVSLDHTNKQANRPLECLYMVLQPWIRNTACSISDRLKIMAAIRRRKPEEAFKLFIRMMPSRSHLSWNYTHVPRWRDWEHDRPDRWNPEDVRAVLVTVSGWLIHDAGNNADRCFSLCECVGAPRTPFFKEVMDHLLKVDISNWSPEERLRLWNKLRDLHTLHSNLRHQPEAMTQEMLAILEGPLRRFEPQDPEARYRWVFGGSTLPRRGEEDFRSLEQRMTAEGAKLVLASNGIEGVMRMVDKVHSPWWLGNAAGRVIESISDELTLLQWSVANDDERLRDFGKGLIAGLFQNRGWEWLHSLFVTTAWADWSATKRGALLSVLPFGDATWKVTVAHGPEIESAYWNRCEPWGALTPEQAQYAGEHFLKHGRPLRALTAIIHQGHGETCTASTELITSALEACTKTYGTESKEREVHMPSYMITEAHKVLRHRTDADPQRVALIEWVFFPLLDEKDLILYEEMAKDPTPFADFLGYFSKPIEPSEAQLTEQERNIARRAYEVLSGWRKAPAVDKDGAMSFEALDAWYLKAVAAVQAKGRTWSDYIFGEKLRYAPSEPDGTWPCVAVRLFLEKYDNETLERAIATEVYNSRGVHSPDAGASERALAEEYESAAASMEIDYPCTARMLRSISQDYKHEAVSEVKRHEIEQDTEYHM